MSIIASSSGPAYTDDERILVAIVVFERGWVSHFERKFQWNGGSPTNECWRQKTRLPGLSLGVVCVIIHVQLEYITC